VLKSAEKRTAAIAKAQLSATFTKFSAMSEDSAACSATELDAKGRSDLLERLFSICSLLETNITDVRLEEVALGIADLQGMGGQILGAVVQSFLTHGPTRLSLRGRDALLLVPWAVQQVRRLEKCSPSGRQQVVAAFAAGMAPTLLQCNSLIHSAPAATLSQEQLHASMLCPIRDSWERLRADLVQSASAATQKALEAEIVALSSSRTAAMPETAADSDRPTYASSAASADGGTASKAASSLPLWAKLLAAAVSPMTDTSAVFGMAQAMGHVHRKASSLSLPAPPSAVRVWRGLLAAACAISAERAGTASSVALTVVEGLWSEPEAESCATGEERKALVRRWVRDVLASNGPDAAEPSAHGTSWLQECLEKRDYVSDHAEPWSLCVEYARESRARVE
jgi:hypothetical protein